MTRATKNMVRALPLAAAFTALWGDIAAAQNPPKAGLSLQNEWRGRLEERSDASFSNAVTDDPSDAMSRLRLGLRWTQPGGEVFFLQPQWSYRNATGYRPPSQYHNRLLIHQAFADVKAFGNRLRVGRQELAYGDERLIGAANWLNIGRAFDGVKLTVPGRNSTTDLFAARLGHFDIKRSEPLLMGVYSVLRLSGANTTDLYFLRKGLDLTATTNQEVYTVGARPKLKFGAVDAAVEGAFQFGASASRRIEAAAYAATVGYTVPKTNNLRFTVGSDFATGGDPAGTGTVRTFDQLFPTNHLHYGIADVVGWRNMRSVRAGVQARPTRRLQVNLEGHSFRLVNPRDNWYGELGQPVLGANGQPLRDPTGAAGKDLGEEVDLWFNYQATPKIAVSAGWARFLPGSFVRNVNGGRGDAMDWFYVQTGVRF